MILTAILSLAFGILGIILFVKVWKMCNDVRDLKAFFIKPEIPAVSETVETPEPVEGGKFGIGQLVIVKEDERQFRITQAARKKDGTMAYYSDRLNKYFDESELEDFNAYWAARRP